MNHGQYDDDEEDDLEMPPPPPAGPSNLLAHLMGGAGGFGWGGMSRFGMSPPSSAFDEYYKAYSVAVMGGNERAELLYGGKIVMPPSALAKLTAMEIPGPWNFYLRNPRDPKNKQTHAGVLEFIADEGIVHLPAWMMKALDISEGDPIRLTGAELPKGKMVKIQAQNTDFLEVSDPKAVLESALRFYSCLSKGDIIEITYNSLVFEFLIMEITPEGAGISIIDTDLEVDFATPVGYVEPPRPAPAPIATMADKLKIDLGGTNLSAGSSRSVSRTSVNGGSGDSTPKEIFSGVGQSLSGKKVKGKGLAKKIEEVDPRSRINRNESNRIVTPDSLSDADRKVPAALILPEGKFFFGFKYIPFDAAKQPKKVEAPKSPEAFQGEGVTLRKRAGQPNGASADANCASTSKSPAPEEKPDPWANLGSGNTLRGKRPAPTTPTPEPASTRPKPDPSPSQVIDATMLDEDDFGFVGSDDDDINEIDSD